MPFEHIREFDEDKYKELMEFNHHIHSYSIFMAAKELGITFGPQDLSIEQLVVYSTLQAEVSRSINASK